MDKLSFYKLTQTRATNGSGGETMGCAVEYDLEAAMMAAWRTSNLPFSGRVVIDRKHLNTLIHYADLYRRSGASR